MPYYREKALAYRGKGAQDIDIAFLALRLGVVLHLLTSNETESMAGKESWSGKAVAAAGAAGDIARPPAGPARRPPPT